MISTGLARPPQHRDGLTCNPTSKACRQPSLTHLEQHLQLAHAQLLGSLHTLPEHSRLAGLGRGA